MQNQASRSRRSSKLRFSSFSFWIVFLIHFNGLWGLVNGLLVLFWWPSGGLLGSLGHLWGAPVPLFREFGRSSLATSSQICSQDGPRAPQGSPRDPQRHPRSPQKVPKVIQKAAKRTPNASQNDTLSTYLIFPMFIFVIGFITTFVILNFWIYIFMRIHPPYLQNIIKNIFVIPMY